MKDAKRLNETNKVQSPEAPHTTYDTMMSRILAAIVLLVGTSKCQVLVVLTNVDSIMLNVSTCFELSP